MDLRQVPWWAVLVAALLLFALLERSVGLLVLRILDGARQMLGPATPPGRGLADIAAAIAHWLDERVRSLVRRYQLDVGKVVGGLLLTLLFVFAAAIETALMKVALELILPFDDQALQFAGFAVDPALAVALALLTVEAVVALVLLESLGMTDLFAWDHAWTRGRRVAVASMMAVAMLGLVAIQAGLAWLRLSQPDLALATAGLAGADAGGAATGHDTGSLARVLGTALSALIPLCATAGAVGAKLLLVAAAAVVIAVVSGVVWLVHFTFTLVTLLLTLVARAALGVLHVLAWPARALIDALDRAFGAWQASREVRS